MRMFFTDEPAQLFIDIHFFARYFKKEKKVSYLRVNALNRILVNSHEILRMGYAAEFLRVLRTDKAERVVETLTAINQCGQRAEFFPEWFIKLKSIADSLGPENELLRKIITAEEQALLLMIEVSLLTYHIERHGLQTMIARAFRRDPSSTLFKKVPQSSQAITT